MLGLLSFQLLLLAKTVSSYTTQISISSMYNNDQMIGMMEDMFNKCKKDPGSSDVCTTFKGLDNVLFTDGTNINKVIEKVPTNNDVLQIFMMGFSGEIDLNRLKSKNIVQIAGTTSKGIQIVGGIKEKVSLLHIGVEFEIVDSDLDCESLYLLNVKRGEFNIVSDYLITDPQNVEVLPWSMIKTKHISVNVQNAILDDSHVVISYNVDSWIVSYIEGGETKGLVAFPYEYADVFGIIFYGDVIEIHGAPSLSSLKPLNITIKESIIPTASSSAKQLDIEKIVKAKAANWPEGVVKPKIYFSYNDEVVEVDKSELEGFETEDKKLIPESVKGDDKKKGLPKAAIIGIAVGCAVVVIVIIIVVVVVVKKKQGVANSSN